jgi:hypothetical protein
MSETAESAARSQNEAAKAEWQTPWRDRTELLRFADLTLGEFFRQLARYGRGAQILEQDGLLLFAGSHPHPNPFRNGAIRLDNRLDAQEALNRVQRFFAPLERSYVFWVRESDTDLDALCSSRNMELVEPDGLPELFLEGPPPELAPIPADVVLRQTTDVEVRRDYVNVVAEGWGMGGISTELASDIFFHPDSMGDPNVMAFVAYVDGRPASGCMALLSYGIAVGGNGATVPWARRRGLAELCYGASLQVAYGDFGIRGSVCQSSPSGAGVWGRMGYQPLTRYLRYIGKPQATTWG